MLNGTSGQILAPSTAVTAPSTFTISTWFRTAFELGGKLVGFGDQQSSGSVVDDRHPYLTPEGSWPSAST